MDKSVFTLTMIFSAVSLNLDSNLTAKESDSQSDWRRVDVLATAYCPCRRCCGRYADGVTAIGRNAYTMGVAVDRKVIPLRSTVKIPGYGTVEADDVGGAIKRNRIDVRFATHAEARQWGRKKITIFFRTP